MPVIVITLNDSGQDKLEVIDTGAGDVVTKPFDVPELLARLRAALEKPGCAPPIVTVGPVQATVLYSGLAPGQVGVYQVNFLVPASVSGSLPVVLTISGAASNAVPITIGQ